MNALFWSSAATTMLGCLLLIFMVGGRVWHLGAALYSLGMFGMGLYSFFEYPAVESFIFAVLCFAMALMAVVLAGVRARKERKGEDSGRKRPVHEGQDDGFAPEEAGD